MNQLTCLIIDDEPIARQGLENYVQQIDFLDLKGICKNAMQANTILKEQSIDLLFPVSYTHLTLPTICSV